VGKNRCVGNSDLQKSMLDDVKPNQGGSKKLGKKKRRPTEWRKMNKNRGKAGGLKKKKKG